MRPNSRISGLWQIPQRVLRRKNKAALLIGEARADFPRPLKSDLPRSSLFVYNHSNSEIIIMRYQ
jgi:hypothetical protein